MMSKIRVTLFRQNPLSVNTSSDNRSKSLTFGRFIYACTNPANHPAANNGFSDVKGAATNAVKIASGCPSAINVPSAAKDPFHTTQLNVCCHPAAGFVMNVYKIRDTIANGIIQPTTLGHFAFGGFACNVSK